MYFCLLRLMSSLTGPMVTPVDSVSVEENSCRQREITVDISPSGLLRLTPSWTEAYNQSMIWKLGKNPFVCRTDSVVYLNIYMNFLLI